jgi:hypothetical protein
MSPLSRPAQRLEKDFITVSYAHPFVTKDDQKEAEAALDESEHQTHPENEVTDLQVGAAL